MKQKRILAFLLSVAMTISLLPTFTLTASADETPTTTTEKNITLGTSALSGYDSTNGYDYIYYGTYSDESVKWRVLDTAYNYDKTDSSKTGVLVLSEYALKQMAFGRNSTWNGSTAQNWCNSMYNSSFGTDEGTKEQDFILGTTSTDSILSNDYLFFLSYDEACNSKYFPSDSNRIAYLNGSVVRWWLRSPGSSARSAAFVTIEGGVYSLGFTVDFNFLAVRPAFNLNPASVLFTSAAKGGKNVNVGTVSKNADISTLTDNDGYKLTMKDSTRNFDITDKSKKNVYGGDTLSFAYTGADTGDNEYISAMIANEKGEVLYYGQLAEAKEATAKSGTASLTVPSDIPDGTYTLKLFNEQINGNYKTDFSSAFSDIALTIGLEGSGTETDPYLIYNLSDLEYFCNRVNGGKSYEDKYVKLMNDIDATSLSYLGIGKDASHAFAGTFDGNNKTLKIALVSMEQYVAPFPYINGATIKNLTVSGTIKTTHKFAAGVVGRVENGDVKLENCLSFVEINSTNYTDGSKNDGTHGGLVAVVSGGTTTINNCGFAGSIIGETTTSCGGIVGWAGSTVKISNSFVAAKFTLQNNSGDTFARNQDKVTVTNCYYLNALSDKIYSGATQATADKFASGEVAYLLQGTQKEQIWGQKIGTDTLPTFSEAKVYEDVYNGEKIYRNEIDGNKIFSLGADKKSATVLLDKAGTYTIVFADYEGNRLANFKTFEVTVDKTQAVRVTSDKDFTLGTGDKIMLWDNLKNLMPMCEAYEVK